jgi:26 proteasome complex subunit DSS1
MASSQTTSKKDDHKTATTENKPDQPQATAEQKPAALEEDDEFEDFPVDGASEKKTMRYPLSHSLGIC